MLFLVYTFVQTSMFCNTAERTPGIGKEAGDWGRDQEAGAAKREHPRIGWCNLVNESYMSVLLRITFTWSEITNNKKGVSLEIDLEFRP